MFPSNLIRAPLKSFPEPSVNVSVIVTCPTRGGCGETSCARLNSTTDRVLQLDINASQTQTTATELRFNNTDYAATAGIAW